MLLMQSVIVDINMAQLYREFHRFLSYKLQRLPIITFNDQQLIQIQRQAF